MSLSTAHDSSLTKPIAKEIFRTCDIRGIVDQNLDASVMYALGRAIGSEALDQGEQTLLLAADSRLSSPTFSEAMKKGILATGCNVEDLGIVPTPLLYFATHVLDIHSGVIITGSHNPKEYNGVKTILKQECLKDGQITHLRERILENNFRAGEGSCSSKDIKSQYINRIVRDIKIRRPYKVVIDCGNGVASVVAPQLFKALGLDLILLFCEPDGNFPNHHPDPSKEENLIALRDKVTVEQADLGIAFDGDGDRLGLITNTGNIIDADKMMLSFIKDILPENPGAKVVFDVKSSQQLTQVIEEEKGEAIMCKTGHAYVKQAMKQNDALLGGEYSAHIFFKHRWFGFDDGLYVAARFLELMDKSQESSQALLDKLPPSFNTPELEIIVSEAEKFDVMNLLHKDLNFKDAQINQLDGIRVSFSEGWGLIRASNTTPKLVLRFEANSSSALKNIMTDFKNELSRLLPNLDIPF